jgi:hypothetical protein
LIKAEDVVRYWLQNPEEFDLGNIDEFVWEMSSEEAEKLGLAAGARGVLIATFPDLSAETIDGALENADTVESFLLAIDGVYGRRHGRRPPWTKPN